MPRAAIIDELVKARNEQGISQKKLETLSGVKQPIIARMELGSTSPQIETILKVLAPLGKTLAVVPTATDDPYGLFMDVARNIDEAIRRIEIDLTGEENYDPPPGRIPADEEHRMRAGLNRMLPEMSLDQVTEALNNFEVICEKIVMVNKLLIHHKLNEQKRLKAGNIDI